MLGIGMHTSTAVAGQVQTGSRINVEMLIAAEKGGINSILCELQSGGKRAVQYCTACLCVCVC